MIQLNLDLAYLAKHFEIGTQRLNQYTGMTIEEVMDAEVKAGNTKAASFDKEILNNPEELAKLFRLSDAQNRYLIIQNMSDKDVAALLPHLSKQDLAWALKYFTQDKLVDLLNHLPQKDLIEFVFKCFSMEEILKLMPEKEMDKFLQNEKINKQDVMKHFQTLKPEELKELAENYFGTNLQETNKEDTLKMLEELSDKDFEQFTLSMDYQNKGKLIHTLVKEDPKMVEIFEPQTLTRPFKYMQKSDLLKAMTQVKDEQLVKMVEQLPPDLIQVVATQIDPTKFADILIQKFPDVISQLAA